MGVRLDATFLSRGALQSLLLLCVFVVAGCTAGVEQGERTFDTKPTGQDTPQAALTKGVSALLDDDYDSVESTAFQGAAAVRPFFDSVKKAKAMRTALVKKFGDGAWEEFNLIEIDGHTTDLTSMAMDREAILAALTREITFNVNGDLASCTLPWSGMTQRFRRAPNGAWYMDMGGNTKYGAILWTGTTLAIDAVMKNIAKEEVTMQELKRIFMETENAYFKKAMQDMESP